MASLPYISAPGNLPKALDAIKNEAVPAKVSQNFVMQILKIPGGSGAQMAAFLKKLGLVNADGSPNEQYRKFRNPSTSGKTLADAVRHAYRPLFQRNEYAHTLSEKELLGLIVEVTGDAHDSNAAKLTASCLKYLKQSADFTEDNQPTIISSPDRLELQQLPSSERATETAPFGLNLGYTINLNLPATADPAVFDAIFRSLKNNLLRADDA